MCPGGGYDAGGYSAHARDELGFEIGIQHRFEQAILPHAGNWQSAHAYHHGMAFNAPLIVRKLTPHEGTLPAIGSFMTLEPDRLTLHAMYVENSAIVLRVVEAEGTRAQGRITLQWPISGAHETDLAGNVLRSLDNGDTDFSFAIAPFEIKTFRVNVGSSISPTSPTPISPRDRPAARPRR